MGDLRRKPLLIEEDIFPFEFLSVIAERESWRKEIYRPVYHIHKWWAKRLGSIFRGILLACELPSNSNLQESFYKNHNFTDKVIFDPFMGSGTTIGEAHKLGYAAIGRDINPVACEGVRVALGPLDRRKIEDAFNQLSVSVGERIKKLYISEDRSGNHCEVLYFFWVKVVSCPDCKADNDLFSDRIIAQNAYPDRKPEIQVCCPKCGGIFSSINGAENIECPSCFFQFNPCRGNVNKGSIICSECSHEFKIIDAVKAGKKPPRHRLYGKLILSKEGSKIYLPTTKEDDERYQVCGEMLKKEVKQGSIRLPELNLSDGYNTKQAMRYNYTSWRDFFNDRQLLALGLLQQAISEISDVSVRDVFLTIFSGLLEFNNMFVSYKGEGTGAVRHMFSHHILKPERTPLEANVWGTCKSSGSFLNLYKSRLMRLLEYKELPFEITVKGEKDFNCNNSFSNLVKATGKMSSILKSKEIYLSCGSSDKTNLPDVCVDAVVTDPPFFDNVHYSELADFFYAWQTLYPRGFINGALTTRHQREVQDADPSSFAKKLRDVFRECHRVLKDEGLLVFTYHHSRSEGWIAVASALFEANFSIINAHPVKSEMSVAMPKSQAKEPIQLDMILVCRKTSEVHRAVCLEDTVFHRAIKRAKNKLLRLQSINIKLSKNDYLVVLIGHILVELEVVDSESVTQLLNKYQSEIEKVIGSLMNRAIDIQKARADKVVKKEVLAIRA